MSLLKAEGLSRRFGGLLAVDNASLSVPEGGLVGLIGPNGAGKTTLFSLLSGFLAPSTGRVTFDGADVTAEAPHRRAARGMARTFQIVQPFAGLSVRDNIAVGAYLRHAGRAEATRLAEAVATEVGLAPMLNAQASSLTVAGRKRLELARALATEPRLLLLDEVLAGLNPSEVRDIIPVIRAIRGRGVAILMIEHVMQAVMNLCDHVHVLSGGRMIAAGPPREVCADPMVIEAYLGHGAAARIAAGGAHA
ncbi:ABC transporter ATP-binding protein [Roseomonas nepalensis]|uniref:ABC transporter ATP-binding protein n=1 Tax=Muricoccus nepalensis TaxID=1854500 RepID=A0A502F3Q8_9PROT|nr:ABC transporter ATP-binding protein [Roseomonas nepalensis]TPG44795.1 ABC transporter ATP-binding protein [Roseomonas nepalensis]